MKHNLDEFLNTIAEQHNIKTLHAYDVNDMRVYCDGEGNSTMEITFRCEVNRQTGKTSRRILHAISEASEGKNVFFFTRKMIIADVVLYKMGAVLDTMNIAARCCNTRIDIEGGGSIQCMSKEYFNSRRFELTCGIKNILYIEDLD